MRKITILCASLLALSFFVEPASADPTPNQMFAVFDWTGVAFDGTAAFEGPDLLVISLAGVTGGFPAIGLSFGVFGTLPFIQGKEFFGVGNTFDGESEHHVLFTAAPGSFPLAIPGAFEADIFAAVSNMGDLNALLGLPGTMAFVTLGSFEEHFGYSIETFTSGDGPQINWDTTTFFATAGDTEHDLHGFPIPPVFVGTMVLSQDLTNSNFIQAPEPGLALLVLVGLAGAGMARHRRRAS